jgi:ATP-dependent DNA helicase RecG
MTSPKLSTPLSEILHTTAYHISLLQSNYNIKTLEDMLLYFPRDYKHQSNLQENILELELNTPISICGTIKSIHRMRTRTGKYLVKGVLEDAFNNTLSILWFNIKTAHALPKGTKVILSGSIKISNGKPLLSSPEYEIYTDSEPVHSGRTIPVYTESGRITSKWFRQKMHDILLYAKYIPTRIPDHIQQQEQLISKEKMIHELHFPSSQDNLIKARYRLAFEEFFLLQLLSIRKKKLFLQDAKQGHSILFLPDNVTQYISHIPFDLTGDQKIALYTILKDMEKPIPMQRLLEADVGAGKTIVAEIAIFIALHADKQAAVMAPTEILARQHFESISPRLLQHGFSVALLTGSMTTKEKETVWQKIKTNRVHCVIGTHTLIQNSGGFYDLGLAVIDEQHRFGVEQRKILSSHGSPHILSMTATPIPRTLAMIVYGDQDCVIMKEKPHGRKPIQTKMISSSQRKQAYNFVESEIQKGRQAFFVCPLVEMMESEDEENTKKIVSVEEVYHALANNIFPQFNIGLVHGKMKAADKQQILEDFHDKKYDILVSTSVIEVGIDIPNASVMFIENSERFGLAQLHQFRGRVGRHTFQSYCFLATESTTQTTRQRIKAMESISDGFELAELDMKLRGAGDMFGTQQSGISSISLQALSNHSLITQSRNAASQILEEDVHLKKYPELQKYIEHKESFVGI